MTFDFSSLIWVFFVIMMLQPLFMGRWYAVRRAQAIRAIERSHGSHVITMIHRHEKRSRQIDMEDAQTIIAASCSTPPAASCWQRCRSPVPLKRIRPK